MFWIFAYHTGYKGLNGELPIYVIEAGNEFKAHERAVKVGVDFSTCHLCRSQIYDTPNAYYPTLAGAMSSARQIGWYLDDKHEVVETEIKVVLIQDLLPDEEVARELPKMREIPVLNDIDLPTAKEILARVILAEEKKENRLGVLAHDA